MSDIGPVEQWMNRPEVLAAGGGQVMTEQSKRALVDRANAGAREIGRLRAENERLRAALRHYRNAHDADWSGSNGGDECRCYLCAPARAALAESEVTA